MNLLLNLPDDLIVFILSSWIELKAVNFLETSICNKKERKSILNLLCSGWFIFEHDVKLNPYKLIWLMRRNMKLQRMTLFYPKHLFIDGNFKVDTSRLISLSVDNYGYRYDTDWMSDENIIEIVNKSPQLSEFSVSCFNDNVTMDIFMNFNSHFFENLTVLDYSLCANREYNQQSLERIASECKKLVSCKINSEVQTSFDPDEIWMKLIRNNPNLTVLHISNVTNTAFLLDAISSHGSGLANIHLSCQKLGCPMVSFETVLKRCRDLSYLCVSSDFGSINFSLAGGNISKRCFKLTLDGPSDKNLLQDVTRFLQKNRFHSLEFFDVSEDIINNTTQHEPFYKAALQNQSQLENLCIVLEFDHSVISFHTMLDILKNKPNLTGDTYTLLIECGFYLLFLLLCVGLTLGKFSAISDNEMLILLTEWCECPLKSLSIYNHDTITAKTFNAILKRHSQLTYYTLFGCNKVDKIFKFVRESSEQNRIEIYDNMI